MYWLNVIGTLAVGAVVVLAIVALFDIVIRVPRTKRLSSDQSVDDSRHPATNRAEAARRQEFTRSEGTER
ncbi:hypothetical protein AWB83_02628 [Caballeronia ptereochthonis]|uniref:Uncharacterized protein n=1 Tax=Caballeronia ptereochthonis TaxID=1777144 RepID=A0A158B194_9BURK|nr:hypothetical protein AWB83_02628 [Caballeronia ptereochthonis]